MRRSENWVDLFVKVTPNSSRDQIIGIVATGDNEYRLAVKIRAVAEKGKANKAVIAFLARAMHLPKSAFMITSGSTARQKTIRIEGDPHFVVGTLCELINAD
ncbi:MAG: DUF167 domain-containing protein [Hyphomicrobiales bacterium]|nr:DUF167 domain-containing protein [Hyphomicrobiales bacterium]